MLLVRTLFHSLFVLAIVHVVAILTKEYPGPQAVLGLFNFAYFFPLSIATGAAINRQQAAMIVLLAATILLSWPVQPPQLVHILLPFAGGIMLGTGIERVINESGGKRDEHS